MTRLTWLLLGGLWLFAGCAASPAKPPLPPSGSDLAAQEQAETKSQNPFDLMKQQCRGFIHNCVCQDDRGMTILAADGQLRSPITGKWQPTMCGIMVIVPDKDHPNPEPRICEA